MANFDVNRKSLEAFAARSDELGIEACRLHEELIKAEVRGAEANKQVFELKIQVQRLKEEKDFYLKKLDDVKNELRKEKDVGKVRVRELEKMEDVLGRKESDLICEIYYKNRDITDLKKNIVDFELFIVRNVQKEKVKKERDELDREKRVLQTVLEKTRERVKETEEKLGMLGKVLDAADWVIRGLKGTTLDRIYDTYVTDDRDNGTSVLNLHWPVLTASTGVVAIIGALWYLRGK